MPSRKALIAAAAALLALVGGGAAALFASSDGGQETPLLGAAAPSATEQPSQATPATPTESQPGAPTETQPDPTETQPAPQPTTQSKAKRRTTFPTQHGKVKDDPSPRDFAVPPAREFSGTGNAALGNVSLNKPAVVKWSTNGRFELRFGRENFPIIAPSASGQLIVPPYSFEQVRVIARGRWKISITPQK
jgi:hypothetical protein